MPGLSDLQNAYANSIKSLNRNTGKAKQEEKKDDELTAWKNISPNPETSLRKPEFPMTFNMLLMSFLFWITFMILIYQSIKYGKIYSRITQEADLKIECRDTFGTKDENAKRVENYSVGDAGPYLHRLKPVAKEDFPVESKVLPPVVTAINSDQFYQFQGLVNHIMEDMHTSISDIKLIVYDIGLYRRERELVEKYCHCEVRDFLFEHYPSHVADISNYAWRPIMLQILLEEFGAVFYVEPTTRFKNPSSANFLRMRGSKNYFLWDSPIFKSLIAYTDKEMFEYFGESRCAFRESSLLLPEALALYRTEATWNKLMKPWLKCALNENCISPKNAVYSGCFEMRHPHTTGCHRYDMSALSIILNRGVQYTVGTEKMVSFRITYTDAEEVPYFSEQPWTNQQICVLICTPIIVLVFYKYFCKRRRLCRI
ncbi:unnamed protein product [Lymnaea stagnalis]|uniref:Uncharacterized protein n=1 Tax=Lymnaea stagnalis TaxID=6523 RepID=A0AAV2HRC2_LYMST